MSVTPVCRLLAVALALLVTGYASAGDTLIKQKHIDAIGRGLQIFTGANQSLRQGRVMTALQRQRWTYGTVQHAQLDADLDQVLQEIRTVAGASAPAARIHVTPAPLLEAYANEDGSIFIAAGMLSNLPSRDALAALIAHEYAHVMMRHAGASLLERLSNVGGGLTSLYLDQAYVDAQRRGNAETGYVREAVMREALLKSVQAGIVPRRMRLQEEEADRKGIDLMIAAGYNPLGMMELLTLMELWEQQNKRVNAEAIAKAGLSGTVERYLKASDQAHSAARKVGDRNLIDGLITTVVQSVNRSVDQASRGHRAAEQRAEQARGHIEARYGDAERPDMRALPWRQQPQVADLFADLEQIQTLMEDDAGRQPRRRHAASTALASLLARPAGQTPLGRYLQLRLKEHSSDEGAALLERQRELARDDSLFIAHQFALEAMDRYNQREQALELLAISRKSLGDPPELLPYDIRFQRRMGKDDLAKLALARCAGTGDPRLRRACEEAR
ncbi:M48 family metalloprotease [Xanthomonas melonis]|uniref:M48 family metalloprotease n=1 Tax=Xanthomonas melonis TaxID=56456 RepID=A0ABS8NXT2_9XANT|nr:MULTISPECIES: M48 family metalloprotease [Xanthomonas]MCC4587374.1 M48 family metalloprotease [Xanthomonas sp. NCPPB 1067]MCD0259589.1 M48 family metalloprotease [Xanthomonas melonis]MCD0267896.1 M48 family metalloprotease [Xanthomonas melonis]